MCVQAVIHVMAEYWKKSHRFAYLVHSDYELFVKMCLSALHKNFLFLDKKDTGVIN